MNIDRFKTHIISLREKLFWVALKIVENEEDAEDAVQETFLKLWRIREELEFVSNPEGFAVRTLKNICIDRIRSRRPGVTVESEAVGESEKNPYSSMEEKDAVAIVREIIGRLPGVQQEIIRMRDIEGYELEEIAAITGSQISAVMVNLSRARKRVRSEFNRINEYKQLKIRG